MDVGGIGELNGYRSRAHPDAACRPNPREPPVTTTTFPLREKMLGKSWSSVSYLDILDRIEAVAVISEWNLSNN